MINQTEMPLVGGPVGKDGAFEMRARFRTENRSQLVQRCPSTDKTAKISEIKWKEAKQKEKQSDLDRNMMEIEINPTVIIQYMIVISWYSCTDLQSTILTHGAQTRSVLAHHKRSQLQIGAFGRTRGPELVNVWTAINRTWKENAKEANECAKTLWGKRSLKIEMDAAKATESKKLISA